MTSLPPCGVIGGVLIVYERSEFLFFSNEGIMSREGGGGMEARTPSFENIPLARKFYITE